jgi:hypothetical protein
MLNTQEFPCKNENTIFFNIIKDYYGDLEERKITNIQTQAGLISFEYEGISHCCPANSLSCEMNIVKQAHFLEILLYIQETTHKSLVIALQ